MGDLAGLRSPGPSPEPALAVNTDPDAHEEDCSFGTIVEEGEQSKVDKYPSK